jgi:ABC-2 type transport system permease protein
LRLKAEYRGESLGESPNRQRVATRESGWRLRGGAIAAVIEKELRTLTRSIPQLYGLFVPMVMVFIIGNVFHTTATSTRHPFQLAFPVCVAYGLVGFIQLIYNNLGAEGSGIQLLLLSPTPIRPPPMRTVLLAKNLCHAGLFVMVAVGSALLASIRLGRPGPVIVATTVAWLAFALPANLAAGDLMSLMMPYRVNLGRLGRQRGSQGNALLSMMIQACLLGIGASVISLCTFLGGRWSAAIVLSALAAVAWVAWMVVLSKTDWIASSRKENLIARLVKTE